MKQKNENKLVFGSIAVFLLLIGVSVLTSDATFNKKSDLLASVIETTNTPNSKYGSIKIIENTNPDAYQDFTFIHNIPGFSSSFILDDDGTLPGASMIPNTMTAISVPNGNYFLTETLVSSYSTTITCTDPSGGTTVSGNTANISISNGETISCVFLNNFCSDSWTQKANFGGGFREAANGFSIGNKGYLGMGGFLSINQHDFWEYNPTTNVWTQKADYVGSASAGTSSFSTGLKGYLGTGNINYKDFWEYNPVTNTWIQKADFGGGFRYYATGFFINGKGYMGTGGHMPPLNGYTILHKDFWEYNPTTNVWTQKADFGGSARAWATGFSIGNKGYIGIGQNINSYFQDFWEYNPLTNAWAQKADFGGGARTAATGFSIGNKGYIGTGFKPNVGQKKDFWEYNPTTNTWVQKADFGGVARVGAGSFSIGNKGYIGTGFNQTTGYDMKDFWEYCP